MAGCDTCPELVLGALRRDCDDTLARIREAKVLATILARAVTAIEQGLIDELQRLLNAIPNPPLFDLRELQNALTCPLTPQSIMTEVALDAIAFSEAKAASASGLAKFPIQYAAFGEYSITEGLKTTSLYRGITGLLKQIAAMVEGVIRQIGQIIQEFIDGSAYRRLLSILFSFLEEWDRVLDGAASFTLHLTLTSTNAALVRGTCPTLYEDGNLPYKQFVEEASTFQMTGIMPTSNELLTPVLAILGEIQMKIAGWQSAQYILLA